MAHIADLLNTNGRDIGMNNLIAREVSPAPSRDFTPEGKGKQPVRPDAKFFPSREKLAGYKVPDLESLTSLVAFPLKKSLSREALLPRRRKISVPELGPMTTVQELAMDSPTIPGRPPIHERSNSAPGRGMKPDLSEGRIHIPISRFPAQPLSPKSLAPLQIPPLVTASPPRLMGRGQRPDVPPKDIDGCSPNTRRPFTPVGAIITAFTPMSAPSERRTPEPWGMPGGHSRHQSDATVPRHRRENSETSIMDRGRPKKRSGSSGGHVRGKRSISSDRRAFEQLPQGFRPAAANAMLATEDLDVLKRQAVEQAERFEVLNKRDVDTLSKELRALDERCEYLRRVYHSMRASRRNLHERICTYLRTARVARFSYESILKQEEALAELDASLDDWHSKLEQAENRRTRVRQKLLEHVAAAVLISESTLTAIDKRMSRDVAGESTPPCSPTKVSQSPREPPPRSPTKVSQSPREQTPELVSEDFTMDPVTLTAEPRPAEEPVDEPVVEPVMVASSKAATPTQSEPEIILKPVTFPPPETVAIIGPPPSRPIPDVPSKEALTQPDRESIVSTSPSRRDVESIRIYADSDVFAMLADVEAQMQAMGSGDPAKPALDAEPLPAVTYTPDKA